MRKFADTPFNERSPLSTANNEGKCEVNCPQPATTLACQVETGAGDRSTYSRRMAYCFALSFILRGGCITSLFLSLLSPLFHSHFLLLCPLPCQTVPRTRRAVSWWSPWFCVDVCYSGNACYHYYTLLLYLHSHCFLVSAV